MTRLRHDLKAYLMTLRMTKTDTIIYFEGRENDPIFYQSVRERYAGETGRSVGLRYADELPNVSLPGKGGSGGKRPLIRAAKFLHRWRTAQDPSVLDLREIAFCVDKDVDDLLGQIEELPGLVYTPLNSVENHLVQGADLHQALCHSLSTTPDAIFAELGGLGDLRLLSMRWRDWVIFCVLATRLRVPNISTFKRPSPFNRPSHAEADDALTRAEFSDLKSRASSSQEFDLAMAEVTVLIDGLIVADRFDVVFKGKWYADIFYSLCESCPNFTSRCRTAGKNGIWIAIRSLFALQNSDFDYYAKAISQSVARR